MVLSMVAVMSRRRQWHPLQHSCLENPMDGGAWWTTYSPWGREESDMTEWLHFHFHFHALEKEMATHSSVLAWRIPGTGEPGGLPSLGSHRVGHDWSDLAAAAAAAAAVKSAHNALQISFETFLGIIVELFAIQVTFYLLILLFTQEWTPW